MKFGNGTTGRTVIRRKQLRQRHRHCRVQHREIPRVIWRKIVDVGVDSQKFIFVFRAKTLRQVDAELFHFRRIFFADVVRPDIKKAEMRQILRREGGSGIFGNRIKAVHSASQSRSDRARVFDFSEASGAEIVIFLCL